MFIPPLNSGYDVDVGSAYPQRCKMLIEGAAIEGSLGKGVGRVGEDDPLEVALAAAAAFSFSNCRKAFSLRSRMIFRRRSKLSSSRLNASMKPWLYVKQK